MRYLSLLITLPFTILVILFAASNSEDVIIRLAPILDSGVAVPLSLLVLGSAAGGFLLGSLLIGFYGKIMRFRYWTERRRADKLSRELENARNKVWSARD